jgi:hypothetical protein
MIKMTHFKILAATVMLSTAIATPVFAQAAISEPGAFAFYHPDGDVLHSGSAVHIGSARPISDAQASLPLRHSSHMARAHTGSHAMLARAPQAVKAD